MPNWNPGFIGLVRVSPPYSESHKMLDLVCVYPTKLDILTG